MKCKTSSRYFDFDAFADDLMAEIAGMGLILSEVAEQTGITLDVLTRLRSRKADCSVDTLVTLVAWAELPMWPYIRTREEVLA